MAGSGSLDCHGQDSARASIGVAADHATDGVYLRESGRAGESAGAWQRVASSVPVSIPVKDATEYEVMAERRDGLFYDLRGVHTRVLAGYRIQLQMHRELSWRRLLLAGGIVAMLVACVAAVVVRRLKRQTESLTGALEEAEGYATLKPGQDPRRIGRYSVLERIGVGGMATVFRVEDEYGDVYALKVPDPYILESADLSQRFFREMEIGRMLHHPHIVRICDVNSGDAATYPYIAQEFVDGETLREVMKREAPMAESRALLLAGQVADALRYAHGKGVVHRDIKPANIMITRAGQVMVMDFGIARAATLKTMTATDTTLGTPQYMAPEQIDSRRVTAQSDLYALGVVLFEMLTGRLPFEEDDGYRLMGLKVREKAPRVSAFRPDVRRRLDNMVALLLQAEPESRPASAEAVCRMLGLL